CDTTATVAIVDGEAVPMEMSKDKRLFPAHLRKALHKRDECCIKCGVTATRCQGHHIVHWADGGITVLDNGCLLCPSCHADIHHNGWQVVMGHDRHPWLIPPVAVDPTRRPIPAYNRRTMNLDNLPAAA
ncbi:HNH endonuclease signature motif containing protein, partial [Gordonia sp. (in: high G+C Gram-positive bacteria)]|uniref:HNH endonuclease n=1 Tax=Gordonia sp. (in: high G+C Gram-positive bacteria) TaxID=84139 RepID=UPI002579EDA2